MSPITRKLKSVWIQVTTPSHAVTFLVFLGASAQIKRVSSTVLCPPLPRLGCSVIKPQNLPRFREALQKQQAFSLVKERYVHRTL